MSGGVRGRAHGSVAVVNQLTARRPVVSRFAGHMLVDKASKWIPFGGGRHACVGRYFAFLQIKSVVSILIRHYDIEYADKSWQPTCASNLIPCSNLDTR